MDAMLCYAMPLCYAICPGAVSHGPFHGAFIHNHRGGRSSSLRKVGQTRVRRRIPPSGWRIHVTRVELFTKPASRIYATRDPKLPRVCRDIFTRCPMKEKRSEWKTLSHAEMWERSEGYFFRLYLHSTVSGARKIN